MSVTLKDLAKACGVSVGTVSRALNEKNEVSAKTSERIRKLAQELGYIPNRAGRALSAQKNVNLIGVLLPSINSMFFDDIKRGIESAADELKDLGISIVMQEVEGWDIQEHLDAIAKLEARGCKAYGLCTVDCPEIVAKINELTAANTPVLLINNYIPDASHVCFVGPNYTKQGAIAAAMIDKCNRGRHLHILVIVGYKIHYGHHSRMNGFIAELDRRKVDYEISEIIEGHDRDIDTQQATMQAFHDHPEIDCVYMTSGSGVSGLGAAIIADGNRNRFVIACDEIFTTRELVKNNIIDFVVCQESTAQGYQAIKKLHEYLNNKYSNSLDDCIMDSIIKIKNHFEP